MKVLYITNALTHYYNLVLSRLNQEKGIDLVTISPLGNNSSQVGSGVKLTKDGINFTTIELEERNYLLYYTFHKLASKISTEKPDVIIVTPSYLLTFLLDFRLRKVIKNNNIGILVRFHSFGALSYQDTIKNIVNTSKHFSFLPSIVNSALNLFGVDKIILYIRLRIQKMAYNLPDAYACYAESNDVLSSYGVNKEKIFITRNSPDTDSLFHAKEKILALPNQFLENKHRIIHVGRLVAWKKVDMLIRSFSNVCYNFPNSELIIIGAGPEMGVLKELIKVLKLEGSVKFLGGVYEQTNLAQYLNESSLYVLAGMGGLSINDAMCFGLPILCSECDGTEKFLVRDGVNGRYFITGDEEDLTNKIIWFFDNPKKTFNMGAASINIIKDEINIHTVIKEHIRAINYIRNKKNN
jgi:glycosyltransferase involved in cell wall biosynthesis